MHYEALVTLSVVPTTLLRRRGVARRIRRTVPFLPLHSAKQQLAKGAEPLLRSQENRIGAKAVQGRRLAGGWAQPRHGMVGTGRGVAVGSVHAGLLRETRRGRPFQRADMAGLTGVENR